VGKLIIRNSVHELLTCLVWIERMMMNPAIRGELIRKLEKKSSFVQVLVGGKKKAAIMLKSLRDLEMGEIFEADEKVLVKRGFNRDTDAIPLLLLLILLFLLLGPFGVLIFLIVALLFFYKR
jgi:hypothetical protein